MKSFLLSIPLVILTHTTSIGQDIPEPDFSQKPYYLKDGKLNEFEKVEATFETKAKGMGYGGVEIFYSAAGLKSSVRFFSGTLPIIIVKVEDNTDPSEGFTIQIGEIKKDKRRFVTGKMGSFGGIKSTNEKRIAISAKKLRDKIYEITFQQAIQPGEYVIIPNQKNISMATGSQAIKMSCFGID